MADEEDAWSEPEWKDEDEVQRSFATDSTLYGLTCAWTFVPQYVCLFCKEAKEAPAAVADHMKQVWYTVCSFPVPDGSRTVYVYEKVHKFDFVQVIRARKLDFYGVIRLINFVRSSVKATPLADPSATDTIVAMLDSGDFMDDQYLQPALADDALLFGFEDLLENQPTSTDDTASAAAGPSSAGARQLDQAQAADSVEALQQTIQQMQQAMQRILLQKAGSMPAQRATKDDESKTPKKSTIVEASDSDYFAGYSHRNIHETMLRDKARTLAYRDFVYKNADLIKGKTVLDVGCGTGILCLFAAKAGAKRVIGIDNADIIEKAKSIVQRNGYSSVISLVRGKVEEVELPSDVTQVDVIISEWMGYFLLFESMLSSVLYARDKWLAPGGSVFPDQATMYWGAVSRKAYRSDRVDFWKDVYGFDMTPLVTEEDKFESSIITYVPSDAVVTNQLALKKFDCNTIRDEDLDFKEAPFSLTVAAGATELDGFVCSFDVEFGKGCKEVISLDTTPGHDTHWKQSLFLLPQTIAVKSGDVISGAVDATRRKENPREYDITVTYQVNTSAPQVQTFSLLT